MSLIVVDPEKCIGCGLCASICPKVFAMQDDGKSHVISQDCAECDIKNAIESCPVEAISQQG